MVPTTSMNLVCVYAWTHYSEDTRLVSSPFPQILCLVSVIGIKLAHNNNKWQEKQFQGLSP